MTKGYEPELGQAAFGASFTDIPMADHVRGGLRDLGAAVKAESDSGADPTDNSGASFENEVFALRAFCWCDQESSGHTDGCPPNFEFKGSGPNHDGGPELPLFNAYWYKWLGRGSTQSRLISGPEWQAIERACLESISGSGHRAEREALIGALAPISPWPAQVSVDADGASVFMGIELPAALEPSLDALDVAGVETLVREAEGAFAAAVAPLGWSKPSVAPGDDRYWLAMPLPPILGDDPAAQACWDEMTGPELADFVADNDREPFVNERWTLRRHSGINLRRVLRRAAGAGSH